MTKTESTTQKGMEVFYARTEQEAQDYSDIQSNHTSQVRYEIEKTGTKGRPFVVVGYWKETSQ